MALWTSFFLFGFYVGTLCGLSASPITLTLMPLLFAFGGGSVVAFFSKMNDVQRKSAIVAIGAVSLGALIGTYSSIVVSSHELLGKRNINPEGYANYLRSSSLTKIESKLMQLEQGKLKPEMAAEEIRRIIHNEDK